MYNYCKTCCHDDGDIGFCDKCYYNHILEEKGIPPTEYEAKPKPITNADRIRAMSDDELADKFEEIQLKTVKAYGNDDLLLKGELKKYWLDWLKKEVE